MKVILILRNTIRRINFTLMQFKGRRIKAFIATYSIFVLTLPQRILHIALITNLSRNVEFYEKLQNT